MIALEVGEGRHAGRSRGSAALCSCEAGHAECLENRFKRCETVHSGHKMSCAMMLRCSNIDCRQKKESSEKEHQAQLSATINNAQNRKA